MIKFYKDSYANLTSKDSLKNENSICFATDRHVILINGIEYGKDQLKVGAIATTSGTANLNDFIFDTATNKLYQKTASDAISTIVDIPAVAQAKADAVSAVISTAFANGKIVLGTTGGITSSNFEPDTTAGTFALTGDGVSVSTISSTLVNAATLSAQIAAVNQNAATLASGSGVIATKGSVTAAGTQWTVDLLLGSSTSSSLKFDSASGLIDDLKIAKISTVDGYAASYALQTGAGVQLGETINVVKDQFLSGVSIVTGTVTEESGNQSYSSTGDTKYLKLTFAVNVDANAANDTVAKTVYIDLTSLVDVYTGVSGVSVNGYQVSGVIDTANNTEGYLTLGANGFAVTGVNAAINTAINTAIDGLGSTTATTDQFVTAIGVDTENNTLTASKATPHASGVTFAPTGDIAATTVQAAIAEVATDAASALTAKIATLSTGEVGGSNTYITSISESNGIITATATAISADQVVYNGSDVSAAIKGISGVISGLDLTQVGSAPASVNGTSNAYTVVNTVSQTDGQVAASGVALTDANVATDGVAASTTKVAISGGSVNTALNSIS
jgi:hypothetical protein